MEWDVVAYFLSHESTLLIKAFAVPSQYANKHLDPGSRKLLFPSPPVLIPAVPVIGGSRELDEARSGRRIRGPEIRPDLVEKERGVAWRSFSGPNPLTSLQTYRFRFQDQEEAFAFSRPLLESLVRNWNEILVRNGGEKAIQDFLQNREVPVLAKNALLALVQARLDLQDWTVFLRYGPEGKLWEWGKRIEEVVAELDPVLVPLLFG